MALSRPYTRSDGRMIREMGLIAFKMAVYTEVTDDALAELPVADYDLGTVVAFRGIAEGVENSNFSLRTTAGDFILTLYEKRVDPAELPWFLGLMEHLAGKRISPARSRSAPAMARRCAAWRGRRPASPPSSPASGRAGCGRAIARRWPGAGAAASGRARLPRRNGRTRSGRTAGARCSIAACLRGADEVQAGLGAQVNGGAGPHPAGPGPAPCPAATSTPTCSPTTCSFSTARCRG